MRRRRRRRRRRIDARAYTECELCVDARERAQQPQGRPAKVGRSAASCQEAVGSQRAVAGLQGI